MAKMHSGCCFVLLLSIFNLSVCRTFEDASNNGTSLHYLEAGNWDQFVLSVQWPFTACRKMHCQTRIDMWTIHGLWPGYSYKPDCPTGCPNVPFDNAVKSDPSVRKYWPDLTHRGSFWSYEWGKHGQCALQVNTIKTCKDYFRKAVSLRKKYSIQKTLENNQIYPSRSRAYRTADIQRILDNKFRKRVLLRCYQSGRDFYLGEVHFCMDRSFILRSCRRGGQCGTPGYGTQYRDCSLSQTVYYPRT